MSQELEDRVTTLEKQTAVLDERTQHHTHIINEIKVSIDKIYEKLDNAMKRPPWIVTVAVSLLCSLVAGLLVYAVKVS